MRTARRPGGRWVLAATILGSSLAFIDSTVVNVALPALQSALDATLAEVQWVVEAYALTLAALLLTGGSLGDRRGRRKVFAGGVVALRRRLRVVRPFPNDWRAHRRSRRARRRRRAARSGQPLADQRVVSSGRAWSRHRHLVRVHRDHCGARASARRLARPTPVLALGLLHQSAARARRPRDHDLASPGDACRARHRSDSTGRALCWRPPVSAPSSSR